MQAPSSTLRRKVFASETHTASVSGGGFLAIAVLFCGRRVVVEYIRSEQSLPGMTSAISGGRMNKHLASEAYCGANSEI
jgi:hypothetical protein